MVLCIGELLIDFICTDNDVLLKDGENFIKKVGGAPLNVSVAIKKLGGEAYMCGSVGKDQFGDILIDTLIDYKVNVDNIIRGDKYNTTLAFVSLTADGERDFNFVRGADKNFKFTDVSNKTKRESSIFHFGSATAFLGGDLEKAYYDALKYGIKNNKIITFDPNYRKALFRDKHDDFKKHCKNFIKHTDILKVSDEEAMIITDEKDEKIAVSKLIELGAKYVLMTLGKSGTLVGYKNNLKIVSTKEVEMVDSTGAGDAFIGAILSKLDMNKCTITDEDIEKYVEFGNIVGGKTVMKYGALSAIPTIKELEEIK